MRINVIIAENGLYELLRGFPVDLENSDGLNPGDTIELTLSINNTEHSMTFKINNVIENSHSKKRFFL